MVGSTQNIWILDHGKFNGLRCRHLQERNIVRSNIFFRNKIHAQHFMTSWISHLHYRSLLFQNAKTILAPPILQGIGSKGNQNCNHIFFDLFGGIYSIQYLWRRSCPPYTRLLLLVVVFLAALPVACCCVRFVVIFRLNFRRSLVISVLSWPCTTTAWPLWPQRCWVAAPHNHYLGVCLMSLWST